MINDKVYELVSSLKLDFETKSKLFDAIQFNIETTRWIDFLFRYPKDDEFAKYCVEGEIASFCENYPTFTKEDCWNEINNTIKYRV